MLVIWTTTTLGITKPLYSGCFFFTSSVSWLRNANCKSKVMHEVNWPTTAQPVWTMEYVPLVRSNVSKLLFLNSIKLSRLQLIHILDHCSGHMYFWFKLTWIWCFYEKNCKAQIFWEGHKIFAHLPLLILRC